MAFFSSDNPIALFLALVIAIVLLKAWLSKLKMFEGTKSAYILPVLTIIGIVILLHNPILNMLSFGIPFLILLLIFLFAIASILFTFGLQKTSIVDFMLKNTLLKITMQVLIICIIAFAASHAYGDKLLEDPTITITDPFTHNAEQTEIEFSSIFTKQAAGMIMLVVVLGLAFVFINISR